MDVAMPHRLVRAGTPNGSPGAIATASTTDGPPSTLTNTGDGSSAPSGDGALGASLLGAPVAPAVTIVLPDIVSPAEAEGASTPAPQIERDAPVDFEPKGFLYNDRYFAKFHDAKAIDLADTSAIERRVAKATMAYLLEELPDVDDFGIQSISMRPVDPVADRDLLHVNPRAHYIVEVHGVDGMGAPMDIPVVFNRDGAVFVDPKASRL